jgi:hypothetical protein
MKDNMSDNFDINVKMPIWKSIKLRLFSVSNQRELLLDFLYWREDEIHPSDANKIVNKYLEQKKSNNSC